MNIAFVGVGRMGANMARRLKDKRFHITAVYDAHRARRHNAGAGTRQLRQPGSLVEVTAAADVIITVVSDDNAMRKIFPAGRQSAGQRAEENCSSIAPPFRRKCTWRSKNWRKKAGAQSLEACMASSITQAREGSLYLMCGGEKAAFDRAKPILKELGSEIRYIGKAGQAAKVKALVNMVMNINTAGLAEGLGLGDALGLDLAMLREVFAQTGANFPRAPDGRRRHAEPRSLLFLLRRPRRERQRHRPASRGKGRAQTAARPRHEDAIRPDGFEGLGELDKSGVAELTFKGRA